MNPLQSQETFKQSLEKLSEDLCIKMNKKNKEKIVVLFVTDINKKQTSAGKYMADVISNSVVNSEYQFSVFDRENLSSITEAKKLIEEGYLDASNAKQLGELLAVEAIVVGNYTILSSSISLTLKALDVNNGYVVAQSLGDLPIDSDAGSLLGVSVQGGGQNTINKGFNNQPLNSNEQYNNPETVNKDCARRNTGDYCVLNSTDTGKAFRIYLEDKSSSNFNMNVLGPLAEKQYEDISLSPGETRCIYDWPVRSYQVEVWALDASNKAVVIRNFNIAIEKCKSKTYILK